jgi:Protein of unknown function (DUF4232)
VRVRCVVMRGFSPRLLGWLALGGAGCAAGAPSAATPVPEPPPAASVELDAGVLPPAPSATAAAGVDAGPVATSDSAEDAACGGADVDLAAVLANKRCRARRDAPPAPASAATDVKITLAPSATKIAPGGHVDLVLELVNTGAAPVPLYFSGDLTLSVEVKDPKGARIAPPAGNAPKNADPKCAGVDCRLPSSHVLLAPGGKAHARIGWDAVKVAWPSPGPTTCCAFHVEPASKGPLAAGAYRVKIPLPYEAPQGNPSDPEVEIRVGK